MTPLVQPAPDYTTARTLFLDAARTAGALLTENPHPASGRVGEDLATDVAILGPSNAEAAIVIVSGTHGVEGYAGSALQTMWLQSGAAGAAAEDVRVVIVHALNPYGFAWVRRVNEDNIDLNRNFVDFSTPLPTNPDYDVVADLLVPPEFNDAARAAADAALLDQVADWGMERMQAAVSSGQYAHPTGLFFGGTRPAWSRVVLEQLVDALTSIPRVAIIDVHTGLGEWGVGEIINSEPPDSEAGRRTVSWLGDEAKSTVAGESVSAELSGEWNSPIVRRHGGEAIAVALEFGTIDGMEVLQGLRGDAWLHAHGNPTGREAEPVRSDMRRAFCDDDPAWMERIAPRFMEVTDRALGALRHG